MKPCSNSGLHLRFQICLVLVDFLFCCLYVSVLFPKENLSLNRAIFFLLSIAVYCLQLKELLRNKFITTGSFLWWQNTGKSSWAVHVLLILGDECTPRPWGTTQQGEAKTFSVLWNFTRSPGFLYFTFLYGETATMKNMFHREEEKLTFWQWNSKPFAAKSHCSEIRDRNKCLHNWQIKIWTASCSIFRCKNTPFMVMSVFILQQNMETFPDANPQLWWGLVGFDHLLSALLATVLL